MKNAKELYPEYWIEEQEKDYFFGPSNYEPIINEIGNVLIQVDDEDYQGDSRILYEKDGKYGFLIFGWGSCSGCDALQSCNSIKEIQDLIDDLLNDVKWFDSLEDLKTYFKQKDWKLDYSWHYDETKHFVKKVLKYYPD
jgi:hypothetical protein